MQEGQGVLAGAGSEPQGTTYLLYQNVFTANLFESRVTNSLQETNIAVDSVKQLAEQRHEGVVKDLTSMAEEKYRREMAQAEAEASRKLHEQGVIHASTQEALTREAPRNSEYIANYMNAKQAADRQTAQAAFAEMQQLESLRESEISRLLAVIKQHRKHSAERDVSES